MSNAPTRRLSRPKATGLEQQLEKDDAELRLEKVLFGDDAGFLESLKALRGTDRALQRGRSDSDSDQAVEEAEDQDDLNDVPDEDLFFLDAGTGELPPAIAKDLQGSEREPRKPVWHDSDDDRLVVSLASNTRLRKLRDTEEDDVVTGREYIRRLRRQYESLHPTPEWITYAKRKRRTSTGVDHSASDSDSDILMGDTSSTSSVQPLADLLRTAGSLTRTDTPSAGGKRRKLRPEVIDIQRAKDVTTSNPSSIDTLQFHPYYPLLLTAGPSSTVSLHHVSPHPPNPNPLLTSLHLKKTPLHTAAFCTPPTADSTTNSTDPTQIFLSSRRRYFHVWDLSTGTINKVTRPLQTFKQSQKTTEHFKISPCGRYIGLISSARKGGGSINILSTSTLQWESSCRIDSQGGIADFDWWTSGNGLAAIGKNGEVSEYSISERRIVGRWHDEGGVSVTVLSIGGPDSQWIAIGSTSGIVNIYDRRASEFAAILRPDNGRADVVVSSSARPKPKRTLDQLTTPISQLVFSADGQMLVMASRWKKNALRLVHLQSCTVYRNWPTDKTPLGRVSAVALSLNGEYLAVGSESGRVGLWEVRG